MAKRDEKTIIKTNWKEIVLGQENKNDFKRELIAIHKFNPKYIFLTETSALPVGYAFKEAWKKAYPGETLPAFYRIEPKRLRTFEMDIRDRQAIDDKICFTTSYVPSSEELNQERKKIEDFFKKRIKDKNAPILVWDEDTVSGGSPGIVREILTNPETYGLNPEIKCKNVKTVACGNYLNAPCQYDDKYKAKILEDTFGFKNFLFAPVTKKHAGTHRSTNRDIPYTRGEAIQLRGQIKRESVRCIHFPNREREEYHLKPKDAVQLYKKIGREAGEELHQELEQKKKKLEQIVSAVLAIGGLGLSGLFLGSGITGNAIGGINQNLGNLTGIVLFIVGIVGILFYFYQNQ